MSVLSFIAAMTGSLAIPALILIVLLVFRRPLTELLGRVVSYEGMGQKLTFGKKLAGAEEATARAVENESRELEVVSAELTELKAKVQAIEIPAADREQASQNADPPAIPAEQQPPVDKSPSRGSMAEEHLARTILPEPAFTIFDSWEELNIAIVGFAAEFAETPERRPAEAVIVLSQRGFLQRDFREAYNSLRRLRNDVAHGRHNPTPGESLAFAESAQQLSRTVTRKRESFEEEKVLLAVLLASLSADLDAVNAEIRAAPSDEEKQVLLAKKADLTTRIEKAAARRSALFGQPG